MDLVVSTELETIIAASAALGALGGWAYDLTKPIKHLRGRGNPEFGDNSISFPRYRKGIIELGFLGYWIVGAVAAVVAVFLLGVQRPSPPTSDQVSGVVQALQGVGVSAERIADLGLTEAQPAFVEWERLIWIALLAGYAGPLLLRAARSRLLELLNAARLNGGAEAIKETTGAVVKEAKDSLKRQVEDIKEGLRSRLLRRLEEAQVDMVLDELDKLVKRSRTTSDLRMAGGPDGPSGPAEADLTGTVREMQERLQRLTADQNDLFDVNEPAAEEALERSIRVAANEAFRSWARDGGPAPVPEDIAPAGVIDTD
jgi:hypothetical protein